MPSTRDDPTPDLALPAIPEVQWSMTVRDAVSSVLAELDPTRQLRTASIGKLFLLVEIARQIETGELDPEEPITRTAEDWVADSGLWYLLHSDQLPVVDLCVLIGGFSDNLATNALVRRIGIPAVAAATAGLGYRSSALLDRVRTERGPGDPPTLSYGTAAELSRLMGELGRGEVISPAVSARVLSWLAANADLSMVAGGFGLDPLAHSESDRGVTLINKTGTISTVRADVGLVVGTRRTVSYAVLAEWQPAPESDESATDDLDSEDPRDAVLAAMNAFGAALRRLVC